MYFLVLFCAVVIYLVLTSTWHFVVDSKVFKVPGPLPLPIVGSGHKFLGSSSRLLNVISELVQDYGDVIRAYVLTQRYMFLADAKYAEAVLSNNEYNTKASEYKHLHPWLGQGLLTATGNRWKTHRKFLTPAFHFNILKSFLPTFWRNDEILITKLKPLANGQSIDIFPIMALLTLDNISEAAMGVSINAQSNSESKYVKAVNEISEIAFSRMRNMFLRYDFLFNFTPHKIRQGKALEILHGTTSSVIKSRRKLLEESNTTLENYDAEFGMKKKSAFLDLMLLSSVDGRKLDDLSIREEVDTFMFEGHDTTTSGLAFAVYNISQHSLVQEKLFKEQQRIFDNDMIRHPTHTDLADMKYLDAVIKESLRLYPSVPIVARMIVEDTKINEYFVPKDTTVIVGILHMQRNPKLFDDPLAFRPERFETVTADQKSAYNWVAFSAGPRNCIGQKFAMMEMKVVLSSIIRRFQLLPSDETPILCADLILRSQNGVKVKMLPRT